MIKKEKVKHNFSKNVNTYDKYAKIQKKMATKLVNMITVKPLTILEIGSGTGYLTSLLLERFPKSKIDIIDISKEMLSYSKEIFTSKIRNYIEADAEHYSPIENYDLIISNATFQWFNNTPKALNHYKNYLNIDGQILVATFAKDTYRELNNSFNQYDRNYNVSQSFINKEDILGFNLYEERIFEHFDNLFDFLKSIKKIGANNGINQNKTLTKVALNKIEDIYIKKYGGIKVTNHIIYINNR